MKTIFLDIDGVLILDRKGFFNFDYNCVNILNDIITATDCEIIISSDRRNAYPIDEIREIFKDRGVVKPPIGYTPNSMEYGEPNLESGREKEIKFLVDLMCLKKWVAIDDLDLKGLGNDNFVKCNSFKGLKTEGAKERVIELLSRSNSHYDVFDNKLKIVSKNTLID